ncbi:MAG TPA: hypothetical protein VEW48_02755 [Thermoanaerobaculia bacterium]|nr:hypothetical protein [Thermoanaerobaculia bacterium]
MPRKAQKPKIRKLNGLQFSDPGEVESCAAALKAALGMPHLRLEPTLLSRGEIAYFLKDPSAVGTPEGSIVPLHAVESRSFWLGAQVKVESQLDETHFRSLSLRVLQGLRTGPKEALLRAEWERVQAPERRDAQPHWHVYMSNLDRLSSEPSQTRNVMKKFHFAMAAQWHLGELGAHYEEPEPEKLGYWLAGWVRYTRMQLELVASRS